MKNTLKKILCTALVVILCLTSAPLGGFVGMELPEWSFRSKAVNYQDYADLGIYNPASQAILVFNFDYGSFKTGAYVYHSELHNFVYTDAADIASPYIQLPRNDSMQNIGQFVRLPYFSPSNGYIFDGWYCYYDGVTYPGGTDFRIPKDAAGKAIEFVATFIPTEGMYAYRINNNEATIVDVNDTISGDVIIPSTLGGYPVVAIGDSAFEDCYYITDITIPGTVRRIGNFAFKTCISLKNVNIPDSVLEIGASAFQTCTKLESVTLPKNITKLNNQTFSGCRKLKNITIPESVTTIDYYAFFACANLEEIKLPERLTYIGSHAFYFCTSLENIVLPESVSTVDDSAFGTCIALDIFVKNKNLTIGKNAFGYGEYALRDGIALEQVLTWFEIDYPNTNVTYGDILYFRSGEHYNSVLTEFATKYVTIFDAPQPMQNISLHCYRESTTKEYAVTNNIDYVCFDHFYSEETTTPATHLVEGTKTFTCECGESYIESIDKLTAHTFEEIITAPTCITRGYTSYECACGYEYIDGYTDIIEHNFTEWTSDENKSTRHCVVCNFTETKINTDNGNIEIEATENPDEKFDANEVKSEDDKYILIEEAFEENHNGTYKIIKAFDINLKNKDGVHVQPDGTVKVKLPLDWEKEGIYKVYRVNTDGTLTDMNAYRQGSHMVFETDHFSLYVIVDLTEKESEAPSKNCSHNCHKSGISGFFWKIINFFNKIFKLKEYCNCGAKHW